MPYIKSFSYVDMCMLFCLLPLYLFFSIYWLVRRQQRQQRVPWIFRIFVHTVCVSINVFVCMCDCIFKQNFLNYSPFLSLYIACMCTFCAVHTRVESIAEHYICFISTEPYSFCSLIDKQKRALGTHSNIEEEYEINKKKNKRNICIVYRRAESNEQEEKRRKRRSNRQRRTPKIFFFLLAMDGFVSHFVMWNGYAKGIACIFTTFSSNHSTAHSTVCHRSTH